MASVLFAKSTRACGPPRLAVRRHDAVAEIVLQLGRLTPHSMARNPGVGTRDLQPARFYCPGGTRGLACEHAAEHTVLVDDEVKSSCRTPDRALFAEG
jgi:hypothetical protein